MLMDPEHRAEASSPGIAESPKNRRFTEIQGINSSLHKGSAPAAADVARDVRLASYSVNRSNLMLALNQLFVAARDVLITQSKGSDGEQL